MLNFFCGSLGIMFNGSSDEWWIIIPGICIPTISGLSAGFSGRRIWATLLIPVLEAIVVNFVLIVITVCVGLVYAIVNEPENMLIVALIAGLLSAPVIRYIFVFFE